MAHQADITTDTRFSDDEVTPLVAPPGCRFTYIVSHEAYYADARRERHLTVAKEVLDSDTGPDMGVGYWEFSIYELENIGCKVEIFDDAFDAFHEAAPLFAALTEQGRTNLAEVRETLDRLGFADETQRTPPDGAEIRLPDPGKTQAVRDRNGDLFVRRPGRDYGLWHRIDCTGPEPVVISHGWAWAELFVDGNVTDATGDATRMGLVQP